MNDKMLEWLVPNGHLGNRVAELLWQTDHVLSGYPRRRIYRAILKEKQIQMVISRPMDIAIALARGDADIGITGLDCFTEFPGAILMLDLQSPITQLVLATSERPNLHSINDIVSFCDYLRHGKITIHTEYPRFLWRYFTKNPEYKEVCNEPPGLDLA